MDASRRTSSSKDVDRSGELSISNANNLEIECIEQDEPGVYIIIRALAGGAREFRRVRFRLSIGLSLVIVQACLAQQSPPIYDKIAYHKFIPVNKTNPKL
ncbi:hypothetical protein AgCh_010435 [Apium graveolens]